MTAKTTTSPAPVRWLDRGQIEAAGLELAKLAKRAAKLGVSAPRLVQTGKSRMEAQVVEEADSGASTIFWEIADLAGDYRGRPGFCLTGARREAFEVILEGPTVVCQAGWSFEATLDVREAEPLIWRSPWAAGEIPAEMREDAHTCQHCQVRRSRKDTFVLRHEEGRWMRVGRSCLKDFLGHDAAALLGSSVTFLRALADFTDGLTGSGSGGASEWDLEAVLAVALEVIAQRGFVSGRKAYDEGGVATSEHVKDFLNAVERGRAKMPTSQGVWDETHDVAAWMRSIDAEHASDYMRNLGAIGRRGYATWKHIGVVTSAPSTRLRELEKSQAQARPQRLDATAQSHVAEPGKRVTGEVEVVRTMAIETFYGLKHLAVLRPTSGKCHDLVWWCSAAGGLPEAIDEAGKVATVRTPVKAHEEYRGRPQTAVQRVTVVG